MLYNRPRDAHQRALDELSELRMKALDECEIEWRTQKRCLAFFGFCSIGAIAGAIAIANWWSLAFLYFAFVASLCIYNTAKCRQDDVYRLNLELDRLDEKRARLIRNYSATIGHTHHV